MESEREKCVRVAARPEPFLSHSHSRPRPPPSTLPRAVSFALPMDIVEKTQGFLSKWSKSGEADWYVSPSFHLTPPFPFVDPSPSLLL